MLWGKKKRLLNELLFFYGVINTNIIMANLVGDVPNKAETFKKIVTALNSYVSKIVLDLIDANEIQKILQKETKLKKIWSGIEITPIKKPMEKELEYFT